MIKMISVSVEQMRKVDKSAVEDFGLSILMMMENASIGISKMSQKILSELRDKKITILSHKGNNGGDGLGAARHLVNRGARVEMVLTCSPNELTPEGTQQYRVLQEVKVPIVQINSRASKGKITKLLNESDLIIDSLLGYNIQGDPRPPIDQVINLANHSRKPILAVDMPSGLDGDSGEAYSPTIKARTTLTLALPKVGLLKEAAKKFVGELWLADLSIPLELYRRLGVTAQVIFRDESIVKIS